MTSKRGVDFLKTVAQYVTKAGGHDSITKVVN